MIYVSERYALGILIFDITIITTALLFRKPKHKSAISTQDLRLSKRVGYYLIDSSVVVLFVGHIAYYTSLANYLEGLLIDAFLFYLGLKVITHE